MQEALGLGDLRTVKEEEEGTGNVCTCWGSGVAESALDTAQPQNRCG